MVSPSPGPEPPTLALPRQLSIPAAARPGAHTPGVFRPLPLMFTELDEPAAAAAASALLLPLPLPLPLPAPELPIPLPIPDWACAAVIIRRAMAKGNRRRTDNLTSAIRMECD